MTSSKSRFDIYLLRGGFCQRGLGSEIEKIKVEARFDADEGS